MPGRAAGERAAHAERAGVPAGGVAVLDPGGDRGQPRRGVVLLLAWRMWAERGVDAHLGADGASGGRLLGGLGSGCRSRRGRRRPSGGVGGWCVQPEAVAWSVKVKLPG